MQYFAFVIFIYFLVKSISFSMYELKTYNNKFGGIVCLILSISSFILAIIGLFSLYGQSTFPNTYIS